MIAFPAGPDNTRAHWQAWAADLATQPATPERSAWLAAYADAATLPETAGLWRLHPHYPTPEDIRRAAIDHRRTYRPRTQETR